jgi:Cu(I)/Ag(I) efflux system membrane fusion protein
MSRWTMFLCGLAVLVSSAGLAGCGAEDAAKELSPEEAKIQATLADLPQPDRAAAEKQRICPVSEQRLGSMGKPVKITVKGQDVFLCCSGCENTIKGDPDTYLAKLNK